ncbi:SdiA-regulated domain-containing protein [Pseudomonas entomophila]|uniref:SdiA-regulated domain-containing protein n=1 Tax=Pseudomonas entomophila TaxID=312306 RepID=UPI002406A6F8|nr:SdiA-regulated domain-containing protein [Pseudomonas entomophila]MDF9619186.1 SdiA-regulated domain-containing protein [Pseudomonas entomophila]
MTTQTLSTQRWRWWQRLNRWLLIGGVIVLVALSLIGIEAARSFWPQQLYAHLSNRWTGDTAPGQNIWLPAYQVVIDAKVVEQGLDNLSGITYDYDRDRLLAITNGTPMEILELSKQGDIQARYPLVGFQDTEGLAYLGNGRLAISDESLQRLDVVTLPATPQPIQASQAQWITLEINPTLHNKGFEGVTYDARHDRLYAIKERGPRQLFEVTGMLSALNGGPLHLTVSDRRDWVKRSIFATDLSDGYYDPRTGHLLVLSDQSKNITELDGEGRFVSIRSLRAGIGGLRNNAPQPEGMTMDSDGNLYVVSEPNLFYLLKKP